MDADRAVASALTGLEAGARTADRDRAEPVDEFKPCNGKGSRSTISARQMADLRATGWYGWEGAGQTCFTAIEVFLSLIVLALGVQVHVANAASLVVDGTRARLAMER